MFFRTRFIWRVALRYFLSGGTQTALTVAGVAFGVTVYLFITALISGLQQGLINRTIGSSSQITLEPLDEGARLLSDSKATVLGDSQPFTEREGRIRDYFDLILKLDAFPGVTAVNPVATGPGFAVRGGTTRPITILGVDEERVLQIFDIRRNIKQGRYDLGGQNIAIGTELARLLGLKAGDKMRIVSSRGVDGVFTVAGVFDAGNNNVNERSVYVSLKQGQQLNQMAGSASRIEMKAAVPFQADKTAAGIRAATGYKVKSWQEDNRELLGALQSQSSTTGLIRIVVMILVGTSIASVLVVIVLQRSREVGILRSMGASVQSIQSVFLALGFITGFAGAFAGISFGGLFVFLMSLVPGNNPTKPGFLFPFDFQISTALEALIIATAVATIAGFFPSRRAALMSPVDVIRQG